MTLLEAQKWMRERNYFAAMMVNENDADALITGYSRPYPTVVRPMIELIEKGEAVQVADYMRDVHCVINY